MWCSWARRFVERGSVHDKPSRYPLETASRHQAELNRVIDMLLQGTQACGAAYRSLEELVEDRPEVGGIMEAVGCTKLDSFWNLLQRVFPGLTKRTVKVKKDRDEQKAQHVAKQLLGRVPVDFKASEYGEHPLTRRVLQPGYIFYYSPRQLSWNLFMDAGKADPALWLSTTKIISVKGHTPQAATNVMMSKQVPCCLNLFCMGWHVVDHPDNARGVQVGKRPAVQFYIIGSARLGSLTLTCATGSRASKAVMHGFQPWPQRFLSEAGRQAIIQANYGNPPEVLQKLAQEDHVKYKQLFESNVFTNMAFLVCSLPHGCTLINPSMNWSTLCSSTLYAYGACTLLMSTLRIAIPQSMRALALL